MDNGGSEQLNWGQPSSVKKSRHEAPAAGIQKALWNAVLGLALLGGAGKLSYDEYQAHSTHAALRDGLAAERDELMTAMTDIHNRYKEGGDITPEEIHALNARIADYNARVAASATGQESLGTLEPANYKKKTTPDTCKRPEDPLHNVSDRLLYPD